MSNLATAVITVPGGYWVVTAHRASVDGVKYSANLHLTGLKKIAAHLFCFTCAEVADDELLLDCNSIRMPNQAAADYVSDFLAATRDYVIGVQS